MGRRKTWDKPMKFRPAPGQREAIRSMLQCGETESDWLRRIIAEALAREKEQA